MPTGEPCTNQAVSQFMPPYVPNSQYTSKLQYTVSPAHQNRTHIFQRPRRIPETYNGCFTCGSMNHFSRNCDAAYQSFPQRGRLQLQQQWSGVSQTGTQPQFGFISQRPVKLKGPCHTCGERTHFWRQCNKENQRPLTGPQLRRAPAQQEVTEMDTNQAAGYSEPGVNPQDIGSGHDNHCFEQDTDSLL